MCLHCSSALVYGDCTPISRVDLRRCKCSGTRLLSAGLAQQHRRRRQAVYPKHCSSALVFGDCTHRVDLQRCKCSGTRLLSAGLAQQHRRTWQAVYPKHCSSALVFADCNLPAEWIFTGVNAVAQGCCQLVWHSSTEEQGRQFTLNSSAVHWCTVPAQLYAKCIFIGVSVIGVNAVAPGCCQPVWHSSVEEQGRQFTLNSAAVHWCMVTAHLYAEWTLIGVSVIGVNAVAPGCCQLVWHSSTEEQGRHFTLNTAAVHWCMVTAHTEWIFKGVNAVAQGCCQLVWHSSTEEHGRQSTLNTAAVHWCLLTAHLPAESGSS